MQRWVLTFVLVVWVGVAYARPTVAVTPIDGDETGDMEDAVTDALDGGDLELIATRKVIKALDRLGYEGGLSEKQAKKVARELEADAVIYAKLGKSGKYKTLKVALIIGGKKQRGFKVTFRNEKSNNFKSKLRDKITEKIAAASSKDDDETAKGDEDEDDEGDDDRKKKKKKKKLARDGDEDEEDPEIEAAVARVSPHSANRVAVRVDIGASFQNRILKFTQRANFPEGPKTYSNTYVPGARIEGELYPFAFMNPKSAAAGLGFAGEYDRTLSLTLRTTAEPNVPVPTKQYHWSVGARFRYAFGKSTTAPSVTLGVDYGKRAFSPDRGQLVMSSSLDVPNTTYTSYMPNLAFRVPFIPQLALMGSAKAMLIQDAGPIQKLDQYGRAKVFGVTAQAGFDIVLGNRFAIRLVGEFAQIGFTFVGNGLLTTSRDGDPDSKDIGGALDRSIGGAATLAVLY
ncbi:MAG: hypothetical protein AB7T06_09370 [Kofleriaceae bacterium]